MPSKSITVGTRGSTLALWQTQHVVEKLQAATPELDVQVKTIQTRGDLVLGFLRVQGGPSNRVVRRGLVVEEKHRHQHRDDEQGRHADPEDARLV